ncbi:MAG: mechanosensitive ion channel family protein [Sedimentisphaerales bacterium]|nr:mechanosensitive ion channel family protein [Sedimentisphaerales bacterium]
MFTLMEISWPRILNYELVQGNEVWRFGAFMLIVIFILAAARVVQFIFQSYSKRVREKFGTNVLTLTTEAISKPAYVVILGIGIAICKIPLYFSDENGISTNVSVTWDKVTQAVIAISIAYALYRLVDVAEYYLKRLVGKTDTKLDDMLVPIIRKSLRITIAVIASLLIAENILGQNVKSLLLSAGVGGIAIAMAAKDTIANFFGSITIFTDRPFHIDDIIKIGSHIGPVEEVGIRSTRVRTLEGHLVTIPNNVMANEMIENIGKRPYIRRTSQITITYDSGHEKTKKAVDIIKEILAGIDDVNKDSDRPPRVYFSDFNDCSLGIYMSYWVKPADFWHWNEVNEKVNFEILKRFNAEGIEFAFPTQTLYVKKD